MPGTTPGGRWPPRKSRCRIDGDLPRVQARLSALVSNELARGVTGMRTAFTTSAERAAAPEPHLVVVLNPMNEPVPEALCLTPETVRTGPAQEQVHVLARKRP